MNRGFLNGWELGHYWEKVYGVDVRGIRILFSNIKPPQQRQCVPWNSARGIENNKNQRNKNKQTNWQSNAQGAWKGRQKKGRFAPPVQKCVQFNWRILVAGGWVKSLNIMKSNLKIIYQNPLHVWTFCFYHFISVRVI